MEWAIVKLIFELFSTIIDFKLLKGPTYPCEKV